MKDISVEESETVKRFATPGDRGVDVSKQSLWIFFFMIIWSQMKYAHFFGNSFHF